jgi:drug/metabolite transporter (DMT)-like permease
MCVAIPFVLVTIAPRFITAAEVNLFFLLETILGPIWVWLIIKEQPSLETIQGGLVIIIAIAIHSYMSLKKKQIKINYLLFYIKSILNQKNGKSY